ncbi:MAG: VOC family protein [Hyphomicrobiaceae bacterium]|nr:MAG: VOC family protein [Hyphomicrobiaceae bacterium]
MSIATGIDHVLVLASDLEAAAGRYERLGFTLTPRGAHLGQGTHNRCVMLEDQYLELIAVHEPSDKNRNWQDRLLTFGEGLSAIALATGDEIAAEKALRQEGLGQGERMRLSRPIASAGGDRAAEFGIVRVATGAVPWLKLFFCRHYNPDLVWQPRWQAHANGARRIEEVVAVDPTPGRAVEVLRKLAGPAAVTVAEGEVRARLGGTTVAILTAEKYAEWSGGLDLETARSRTGLVGATIAVDDLPRASRVVEASGVFMVGGADWIIIPPTQTSGVMLKLVGAGSAPS